MLVEGESDVHVLAWCGVAALGLPGAKCFGEPDQLRTLGRHQSIFVVREPGEGGDWLIEKVAASPIAGKAFAISFGTDEDPRGLWRRLAPDRAGFAEAWRAIIAAAVPVAASGASNGELGAVPAANDALQTAPEFSEEALALAFADEHTNTLRYCDGFGRWYLWDGRWVADEKRVIFTMARKLCRAHADRALRRLKDNQAQALREASEIASKTTVANVVGLANCDERLAVASGDFDRDPMLTNTSAGTIELKTSKRLIPLFPARSASCQCQAESGA